MVAVPQKDYRLRGAAAPQRPSLSWGTKTYKGLNMLPLQQPKTMYSQLIVTACKAENENEEALDKVWARSAMTTEPVEGASELGNQIFRLMAALTKAGQGNSPSSVPNSPRHGGHGMGRQMGLLVVAPIPIIARLVQDRLPQPAVYLLVAEQEPQVQVKEVPKDPKMVRAAFQTKRTLVHLS